MSEFSRRVDVQIIKDVPLPLHEWKSRQEGVECVADDDCPPCVKAYAEYRDRFQPYRWRAVAVNNEPIAHGESYFNVADCREAIELLLGDDTTVYRAPMQGEDRSEKLLRYGKTDRDAQEAQ